ncbi:topoisomerase II-associated protein PAT1 [Sodiomyces alkalinus F11]|uniref:Topoisomerase II-associated protein PAT1 n=1 Tax=Sodiomyces alkalinus (strain CBS 110278 / VKM F-3762 / F11) TaxID=1314773 RepID=A0A3N2Q8G6_SODAK|nr:topoisomerase II-associated protein PAT1 [Sodiomyces alkalinus F11]ROT42915.1 topoisomerase II-associated protein PAT1 [Sodiomyces alkalinus F11]
MSFFGFDSQRHNAAAPGFSQAHDPFAGLSQRNDEDDDAVDFDDTYDGLGDQLDESGDAFNDDTFGGGDTGAAAPVGKDFDFFGQTAKVSSAIEEEHVLFTRQQPAPKAAPASAVPPAPAMSSATSVHYTQSYQPYSQPVRTGYEKYKEPEAEPIPDLHVDASLWGMPAKKPAAESAPKPQTQPPTSGRKVMSLEEVERAMREQAQRPSQPSVQPAPPPQEYAADRVDYYARPDSAQRQQLYGAEQSQLPQPPVHHGHGHPVTILQRPHSRTPQQTGPVSSVPSPQPRSHHQLPQASPIQPTQILQNPNRLSGDASRIGLPTQPAHRSQGSVNRNQQQQQQHFAQLSEEDKAAYLDQETKRAKRNHKIWLLSKDNGLMTPQDKNFITRIQLQQLVSATGNPGEVGNEGSLAEDFYYQVLFQIRGGQRQNPNQPLNNFAQTYLFQTGSRQGGMRRQGRAAENHAQRMEQQVQRAVEAAKNKPKNPQLVIAGSLGKISFSNAKTPKPLLNIKRGGDAGDGHRAASNKRMGSSSTALDRKAILRNIERVYNTVMLMEDHARLAPPPPTNGNHEEFHAKHGEWLATAQALNAKLWDELKVHEPIRENTVHPFIAFLTFPKGKKVFSRVFRHISFEQRTTILTMIIFHLDSLDVVRDAQLTHGEKNLSAQMRENIELFSMSVMPSLFAYFNDTQIDIVTGVLGIITKLNVDQIAKTRVGTSMLTLVLSRAELLKQAGGGDPRLWNEWDQTFDAFFNVLEPTLPHMFPGSVNAGEDVLVWQLLAAIGVSANPEQQQRLVLAVKDRVLDTVAHAKTLPASLAAQRLGTVNLFMHSIGLDVELLQ